MNTIELIESCYGPDIRIDGESLFVHEFDARPEEVNKQLRLKLVFELIKKIEVISITDLKTIGEILVTNNNEWEFSEEDSNESSCEQCGNWNYLNKYIRK